MVFWLALTLTLSPGEREQSSGASGFAEHCPASPARGFSSEAENDSASLSLAHRMGEGGRRPGEGLSLGRGEGERAYGVEPVPSVVACSNCRSPAWAIRRWTCVWRTGANSRTRSPSTPRKSNCRTNARTLELRMFKCERLEHPANPVAGISARWRTLFLPTIAQPFKAGSVALDIEKSRRDDRTFRSSLTGLWRLVGRETRA